MAEKRGQFKLPLPSPPPFSPPPPLLCTYETCVYSLLFGLQKPLTFSDRFETQPIAEDGQKNWQVQLLFDQIEQPSFRAARSNGARKAKKIRKTFRNLLCC